MGSGGQDGRHQLICSDMKPHFCLRRRRQEVAEQLLLIESSSPAADRLVRRKSTGCPNLWRGGQKCLQVSQTF